MPGRPTGRRADARTRVREAYFLDLAQELARTSAVPLMLTGGITLRETAERVLGSGVALVGMGAALAVTPDLPDRWRYGREADRRMRRCPGPTRRSSRPPSWPRSGIRCTVSPRAAPFGPAPARLALCSASRADSDGPCAATAPGPPHRGKQAGARTRARTRRRAGPCDQYASGWGARRPPGRRRTRGAQRPGFLARPARVRDMGCASRVRRDDEEGGYALFCPTGAGWRA